MDRDVGDNLTATGRHTQRLLSAHTLVYGSTAKLCCHFVPCHMTQTWCVSVEVCVVFGSVGECCCLEVKHAGLRSVYVRVQPS